MPWLATLERKYLHSSTKGLDMYSRKKDIDNNSSTTTDTLAFYIENAAVYAQQTFGLDMSPEQLKFAAYLPTGAAVLDAGCGSGRDSAEFSKQGFKVTAIDGCLELVHETCRRVGSEKFTGLHLQFDEMSWDAEFDGVWACASLLHLPQTELMDALARIFTALKNNGVFYSSFKEGTEPRTDSKGRYFNDFTPERLTVSMKDRGFEIEELWRTTSKTEPGMHWVNIIVRKVAAL